MLLVVLGNKQEYRLNYDEIFALVAKMATMHTILSITTSQSWLVHQMDVKNAFLHGDLKEKVYIKLPTGMPTPLPNANSVDIPMKINVKYRQDEVNF